jgi:hypothetical protein
MVTKLALEGTIVSTSTIVAHDRQSGGVSSSLKGILELHPMWICPKGFSVNGRFVILFGVKVKTANKGM